MESVVDKRASRTPAIATPTPLGETHAMGNWGWDLQECRCQHAQAAAFSGQEKGNHNIRTFRMEVVPVVRFIRRKSCLTHDRHYLMTLTKRRVLRDRALLRVASATATKLPLPSTSLCCSRAARVGEYARKLAASTLAMTEPGPDRPESQHK